MAQGGDKTPVKKYRGNCMRCCVMKAKTGLLTVVAAVLLVVCCAACSMTKTAMTASEFESRAKEAGFELVDAADQFQAGEVESVTLAVKAEYKMEFYVLPSEDQTKSAFAANQAKFESAKGSAASSKSVSIGNYSYYYQTTQESFYLVSRVDDTMLYCVADAQYKDAILDLAKKWGYV